MGTFVLCGATDRCTFVMSVINKKGVGLNVLKCDEPRPDSPVSHSRKTKVGQKQQQQSERSWKQPWFSRLCWFYWDPDSASTVVSPLYAVFFLTLEKKCVRDQKWKWKRQRVVKKCVSSWHQNNVYSLYLAKMVLKIPLLYVLFLDPTCFCNAITRNSNRTKSEQ